MIDILQNELVFTESFSEKEKPFTTNVVIANYANINVRSVNGAINKYMSELKQFGKVIFKKSKLSNSKNSHPIKIFLLNKNQAMFLFTVLRNTDQVIEFKLKLIKAFDEAIELLSERKNQHEINKPVTKSLHDAINSNENITGKWAYSNVQKLIYKKVLGIPVNQFRMKNDIPAKSSKTLSAYLTTEQGRKLQLVENVVTPYLALNYGYEDIKSIINSIDLSNVRPIVA